VHVAVLTCVQRVLLVDHLLDLAGPVDDGRLQPLDKVLLLGCLLAIALDGLLQKVGACSMGCWYAEGSSQPLVMTLTALWWLAAFGQLKHMSNCLVSI
jgi:hypothetical protein